MTKVPVKLWWDNRAHLTVKMLTSLRDALKEMRTAADVTILLDKPAFGLEREERDRRDAALLADLDYKIGECDKLLSERA